MTRSSVFYSSGSQMGVRVPLGVLWSNAGGTQKIKTKKARSIFCESCNSENEEKGDP